MRGKEKAEKKLMERAEATDLMRFGMIPEFVSRFPMVVSTVELSVEQLCEVLTRPKSALLKQYTKLYGMSGTDFHVTPAAMREIAVQAKARGTGARGLRSIMERILLESMYHCPDEEEDINAVVLSEDVIKGWVEPVLIRGEDSIEAFLARNEEGSHNPELEKRRKAEDEEPIILAASG